jgi:hypothetical protein
MSSIPWASRLSVAITLLLLVLLLPEVTSATVYLGIAAVLSEVLHYGADVMDIVMPPLTILFCIVGWIGIGWMSATYLFTVPSYMKEQLRVRAAVSRGRKLSSGSRLRITVAWLMPALLGWVLYLFVTRSLPLLRLSCPVSTFPLILRKAAALQGLCISESAIEITRIFSEALFAAILGPIFPIALTLLYYDQRIRREGFDIERMMEAAELTAPPVLPGAENSVAEEEPLA